MRQRGNRRLKFGAYEAKRTLGWRGLAWTVASVAVAWGLAELVPYLADQAGWVGGMAGVAAVALRAAKEWLADNEGFSG